MKTQVNKQNVGLRIKKIRQDKGYTLEEFGELFGASKSNVYRWEQGKVLPNKDRLQKISKFSDQTVNELLYGSVEEYIKENFNELIELAMLDLKGNGYEYPPNIDYKKSVDKFLNPELNNKLSINNEIAIYNYFKDTFVKSFPRFITNEDIVLLTGIDLFATITTISEDMTPNSTLQKAATNRLIFHLTDFVDEHFSLYANEKNKDDLQEMINKINSLREKDN